MFNLVFTSIGLTMLLAAAAHAQTWYLMAPDGKIMSNPGVAGQDGAWAGDGAA